MKRESPMLGEYTLFRAEANDAFPLYVVIVYNNMHAAMRAAETVDRLSRKFFGQMWQRLLPVPMAQLSDPILFDHLLSDASSADMIIVSFNGPGELPATVKEWVKDCLGQKSEGNSAVVALLSSSEQLDEPETPRYQFMKNAAKAAGLDFFAPKPEIADESCRLEQLEVVG